MRSFFGKKNFLGMGIAVALLILGFLLLGRKPATDKVALNVAPFVLVFAYLVVLPWSIWKDGSKGRDGREGV